MPYGILKVDTITFTNGGVDQSITVSGIVASTSGNLTVTGTISGDVIRGGTTVSGATVTGAVGQFGNLTAVSGVFTTQISGATVTGNVGRFTSVTGGTAGFTTLTGSTVTGNIAQFTTLTGGTAGFTTVTGSTVTGTTANFTSGNFTSISGGTHTITSGVFASGTVTNPSISFVGDADTGIYASAANQVSVTTSGTERLRVDATGQIEAVSLGSESAPVYSFTTDPNTGIYSPGADQVAISTNGTGRLFVDANGNVGVGATPTNYAGYNNLVQNGSSGATLEQRIGGTLRSSLSTDSQLTLKSVTLIPLVFGIGNTEVMRLDTSGRLGLGTSSPAVNLEVYGAQGTLLEALRLRNQNAGVAGVRQTFWQDYLVAGFTASRNGLDGRLSLQTTDTSGNLQDRLYIDGSGRVGIGDTAPSDKVTIAGGSSGSYGLTINNAQVGGGTKAYFQYDATNQLANLAGVTTNGLAFSTLTGGSTTEKARLDSSGRLLVGTSTAFSAAGFGTPSIQAVGNYDQGSILSRNTSNDNTNCGIIFQKIRGSSAVQNADYLGEIRFNGYDGTADRGAAQIYAQVDGTPGTGDMPGRLVFSTTADGASSPTERMRIDNGGTLYVNRTTKIAGERLSVSGSGATGNTAYFSYETSDDRSALILLHAGSSGATSRTHITFLNSGALEVGSIKCTGSATSFNTSSDYRLKENVVPLTGAIDRINQLQVHRFNFIADPDTTFDGFLAHEAQEVVPECATGTKDEVDADGNPKYQGIDQSKLVPLLTAALQETIAELQALKAEVADLKAS